jgi:hypothetical protein
VEVLADGPTRLLQALREGRQAGLSFRIACSVRREHTNPSHPLALLRARRERPGNCAADQCDDFAAS